MDRVKTLKDGKTLAECPNDKLTDAAVSDAGKHK